MKGSKKEPTFAEISQAVAVKVEQFWLKSLIPYVSHDIVLKILQIYNSKYISLFKSYKDTEASNRATQ